MLINQTLDKLRTMRLTGMADTLEQQQSQPNIHDLSFEERFGLLVDHEFLYRDNRRLARLLKAAKLRVDACVEDIDYRHRRGLKRPELVSLTTCDWIRQQHNLTLTGSTGTGKTWLACALGNQACRLGFSVRYVRLPRLFETIRIAHGDGSYPRLMNQLTKTQLLILDDWGIHPLTAPQRNDLMEIIEERHDRAATLIAGQLPVEHWHDYIGDAALADAILDRLLHNTYRIALKGESMRKKTTKS